MELVTLILISMYYLPFCFYIFRMILAIIYFLVVIFTFISTIYVDLKNDKTSYNKEVLSVSEKLFKLVSNNPVATYIILSVLLLYTLIYIYLNHMVQFSVKYLKG